MPRIKFKIRTQVIETEMTAYDLAATWRLDKLYEYSESIKDQIFNICMSCPKIGRKAYERVSMRDYEKAIELISGFTGEYKDLAIELIRELEVFEHAMAIVEGRWPR